VYYQNNQVCISHFKELKGENLMNQQFKVIVEKHPDGYVSYPLGLKGVVVSEGDTYEEALTNVKSAIKFHIETFGKDVFEADEPVLEAFVVETGISV
jgi:predicted RNase H-like HicB family nuclease